MTICRAAASWLFVLVLCLCGFGCSRQKSLQPVQGKVLYKNQPLNGATVTFHPQVSGVEAVDLPVGQTKEDGTFHLLTGSMDGAEAGTYVVTIVCMEKPKTKPTKPGDLTTGVDEPQDRLRGAYADPAKSKFTVEVKSGVKQLDPFELK